MEFRGVFTALVTPFTKSNHVDYVAFKKLIDFQMNNGVKQLLVAGSTGEAHSLSKEEYRRLIETAKSQLDTSCNLVVGVSQNNTDRTLERIALAREAGADAILLSAPYYNKPSQRGLYNHFSTIAKHSDLPIVLYNVPSRTACSIENETIIQLASEYSNIVAVKEASGDVRKISDLIVNKPKALRVLVGDDHLTLPLMVMGADGAMSVVSNVIPNEFSLLVNEALKGNFHIARRLHFHYQDLMQLMETDTNPAPIKSALFHMDLIENELRSPMYRVEEALHDAIGLEIRSLGVEQSDIEIPARAIDFEPILN